MSNNMKNSKKFEEKRNNMKAKSINNKNKMENMENIMKEINDNFEEKDNDIHLSGIDNSNSKIFKKISNCHDEQVLFRCNSDNDIILESK